MIPALNSFIPFQLSIPFIDSDIQKISPLAQLDSLDQLFTFLSTKSLDQWLSWKKEIRQFIHEYGDDPQDVDRFLSNLTDCGLKNDPLKTRAFVSETISLERVVEAVRFKESGAAIPFEDIEDWATEHAPLCPDDDEMCMRTQVYSEWKRFRPVIISFIPNLIDLFLGAFNFLDARKKYTTLWEKHLLLEIVYKFFVIPYCIYKVLQPVVEVTAKVYLVTALVIISVGILISIYQRWLRPIPDEIVNCTNLDKRIEKGFIDPKVGQAKELGALIAALEADSHVLLVGRSGEGKTALAHHLIQLKHQKQLPDKLQRLAMFEVDCGVMISSVTFGHSDLINQIKDQNEGFEEDILLFFDEFFQIAAHKDAFTAFKKRFLEDKPHSKFVATVTLKEFKEIQKLDIDGSFRRRVVPILIDSSSDEQNLLVVREFVNRTAHDILVKEEAIDKVIDLTSDNDYLPDIGKPAKAIKIMMDAIGICRSSFNPHYVSEELSEARQKFQSLKLQAMQEVKISQDLLKRIRSQRQKIETIEKKLEGHKSAARHIQSLIHSQRKLHQECFKLTRRIAVESASRKQKSNSPPLKRTVSEKDQVIYLWTYFYAIEALKKQISARVSKVRASLPVQVDEDLIEKVFLKAAEIEDEIGVDVKLDPEKIPLQGNADMLPSKVELNHEEILDDDEV